MSDSIRTSTEFVEYSDKLSAERKKRDLIDIKIRKVVETSAPLDVCDEQRRIDHWTQVIGQNNQQYDKKILIYKEQIALYERLIENVTLERDKPDFRPRYELKKAQQDLELKKSYKPKELQKLEIDLEVIDKKIESFKNLLGMSKPELAVEKRTEKKTITPSPSPPSSNQEKSLAPKPMRPKKIVPVDNTVYTKEPEPVERPATPLPEPIEFVTLPEPAPVAIPLPPVPESHEPRLILNTKVMRPKKSVAPA
jgi:hypothetical protein